MSDDAPVMLEIGEDYPEIREAVRRICANFPRQLLA